MAKIAVIDTETTWGDKVMSVGVVIADAKDYAPIESRYYVFDPEYKDGGLYSYQLFLLPQEEIITTTRRKALKEIDEWFAETGVKKLFAYNAAFDKNHLKELAAYPWHDIMRLAAYKQYNRFIPEDADCCRTGKLKKNYGVEPITRMLSGDNGYLEMHNALQDAKDELDIMRMLGLAIDAYENARL